MTTGETVVVTWANAQATLDAWQQEEYYAGNAANLVEAWGGIGLDVETIPDAGTRRAGFMEELRYRYGACINLRQSRAIHPKLFIGGPL